MLQAISTFLLIIAGEACIIGSEVIAAKYAETHPGFFIPYLSIGIAFLGAVLLIASYIIGIRFFKDIWTVTVISVAAIIIFEPIMNYAIFKELPSAGGTIGMILATLGLIAALF